MAKKATGAWMKLYLDAFKGGTGHMSPAELGAYTRLLLHGWDNGGIPTDLRRMARIAGMDFAEFEVAWEDALREKFAPHPDDPKRLVNAKQEAVRGEQEKHVAQRKAAADARWSKGTDAGGMRDGCDRISDNPCEEVCEPPCETDEVLGIQGSGTEVFKQQASGAHPREAAAASEGGPDWVAEALAFLRKCGVPVQDSHRMVADCLGTERWGPASGLSKPDRLRALTAVAVRAKAGTNPVGLLDTILVNESAAQVLKAARPASSKWVAGSGQRTWEPSPECKAKALRGRAEENRVKAKKKSTSEAERLVLLREADQCDGAAKDLEAVA